jgi:hypothetical protein
MLGGVAADEQFPPDDDDDFNFNPNEFHFHGFGHNGPPSPPSPENHAPAPPSLDHLQAMGWGVWQILLINQKMCLNLYPLLLS